MAKKKRKSRLIQTKAARHRRRLYALRAKEKSILRKRIRHQAVTESEYKFLKARRFNRPKKVNRQRAANKTVRAYIQISFIEKIKGEKKRRAKIRKQKQGRAYRADIDRGNFKIRTYSEYLTITKADVSSGNLSHRFRKKVEAYQSKFNAAKNFQTMNASVQLFVGKIMNPYTGLIGRPASVTVHARMRSVKRRKETSELDEMDFSFELTEFEDMIDYMEDIGFSNYTTEGDEE